MEPLSIALYTGPDPSHIRLEQFEVVNGKPWFYGLSGQTQCCGAKTLIGPQKFDMAGFLTLVKKTKGSIYITAGYHDKWANDLKWDITRQFELESQKMKEICTYHTHQYGLEWVVCIEVHDIVKFQTWRLDQ